MEKIVNKLAVNTLLFVIFTGLFVLPVFSFFTFKVATSNSSNVLGQTSISINGFSVVEDSNTISLSGVVSANHKASIPLSININSKNVYISENAKEIKVVKKDNVVEIYNLYQQDQKVEILLH